jgi:hypothetical protein
VDLKDKARNLERSVEREMEMRGTKLRYKDYLERRWAQMALEDHVLFLSLQGQNFGV